MANQWLTGDGNWGTAGNWQPGGTVPVSTDIAIIPKQLANNVTDPGGDAEDVDLAVLCVHPGYKHSFGSSGAPIATAAAWVELFSSGPCYLDCDAGGVALDINELIVALANSQLECQIGGAADPGEIDYIRALRGRITLKGNIDFAAASEVRIGHVSNVDNDVYLEISDSAETLAKLIQNGGRSYLANVVTALYVERGRCIKASNAAAAVYIGNGGIVEYEDTAVTGDNVDVWVYPGGRLDLMTNSVYKVFRNVYVYPGADIRFDPKIHEFDGSDGLVDMRRAAAHVVVP